MSNQLEVLMKLNLFFTFLVIVLSCSLVFGQTLTLHPYGVSPRDVGVDAGDIFDVAFNGLANVGVNTKMYLKGTFVDSSLTSPAWAILSAPGGSAATLGTPVNVDTTGQITTFTPDVAGEYEIEFSDGGTTASLKITAGYYIGIEDGNCAVCHNNGSFDFVVDEWEKTGHYSLFEDGMNGIASDHYGSNCISCHTTGYDTNADNDGFDDREFVFPDSAELVDRYGSPDGHLFPGVYDSLLKFYPDAMLLARIQCESCHGPLGTAGGSLSHNPAVTLDAGNCAWCHDSGTHHVYPEQWDVSNHATLQHAQTRSSCARCHDGAAFVEYLNTGGVAANMTESTPITCAACHDPHSPKYAHQLRTLEDVTLSNGMIVAHGGNGKLCINCHMSRRNAADYTGPDFSYSSHFGPHYSTQADVLIGTNVPTFGKTLPVSAHFAGLENACVDCHMAPGHADTSGNVIKVGSHSFRMSDDEGVDNVAACEPCHGHIGEDFAEKKFFFQGTADHDGDGTEEGLQEEVHGLLEEMALMLPPIGSPDVDVSGPDEGGPIYTLTEVKAAYNYFTIEEDRSFGIHNPAFTIALLKVSMQALENNALEGDIVAIEDVPNDQGKQVRIVWNKFVDDGIATDPVEKYIVKRDDSDASAWTTVGEASADGSPRYALVVPTLYDSTAEGNALTSFMVVSVSKGGMVYESAAAQGYSVDNLAPSVPAKFAGTLAGNAVQLSWEEQPEADFRYFALYRSTSSGFTPDAATLYATTTDISYLDNDISGSSVYYYRLSAVDFNGNEGETTAELAVTVTSIEGAGSNVPTVFSLDQNYPNPFNPTTTIRFGLPQAADVKIVIYNVLGEPVRTLTESAYNAGYHHIVWDGRNNHGKIVSAGMYLYRIDAGSFVKTNKMLMIK